MKIYVDSYSQPRLTSISPQRPLYIENFDYSVFSGEQVVSRFKAERLEVRPRKFGIFRFKSVNEIFLKQLNLETFATARVRDEVELNADPTIGNLLSDSFKDIISRQKLGRIQQVAIDGFEFLKTGPQQREMKRIVSARHAVFDIRKEELTLRNADIEVFENNRRLIASQLRWDQREKLWLIDKKATFWNHGKKFVLGHARLNELLELVE